MTLRNALGSVSALSLSANPATLPVIATAAGVAATVAAAAFVYKSFKNYEEKKHRKEIEAINKLHDQFLARIIIYDYREIQGFPPIFKLTADEKSSAVDFLHYTDEEIENIGKIMPHGSDIALSVYREAIANAILKLQEYYLGRRKRDDITAAVLGYLLNMLQTHCLNFEGYAYDIAYLHAIANFVNAYASQEGRVNSQHFSRLNPVYRYLLVAKQALEKHKEKLSLEEMLSELRDVSMHQSRQLIRTFARLVNRNKDWPLIKTAAMDEIAQGYLRRKYIHTEIVGAVLWSDKEIDIPASVYKDWLVHLANYYMETLGPDCALHTQNMLQPAKLFTYPDYNEYVSLSNRKKHHDKGSKKLTEMEEQKLHQIENHLLEMQKLFKISMHFLSTELDIKTKNSTPKFLPIKDNKKLLDRAKVFADYATLIHKVISLQFMTTHLIKSEKQLGEIYIKNPQHFCNVFNVLYELSRDITDNIELIRKDFTGIQLQSLNNMQLQEKEQFPEEIKSILDSAKAAISRLTLQISEFRDKVANHLDPDEPTKKSVKHEMFVVVSVLADMYNYSKVVEEHDDHKNIKIDKGKEEAIVMASPIEPVAKQTANEVSKEPLKASPPADKNVLLEKALNDINHAIADIQAKEKPLAKDHQALHRYNDETGAYDRLYNDLLSMQSKTMVLAGEHDKSVERKEKAEKLLELVLTISHQTRDFLCLEHTKRTQHARQFYQSIHAILTSADTSFIDWHKSKMLKTTTALVGNSFFKTDTRKKLNALDGVCERIAMLK